MKINHYTRKELEEYLSLYSTDPIILRLLEEDSEYVRELEYKVKDLTVQLDEESASKAHWREESTFWEERAEHYKSKLDMWDILATKNFDE
jgi:hypothetical protein